MTIPVACPSCNTVYHLAEAQAGKRVRCKQCEAIFPVPELSTAPATAGIPEIAQRVDRPRKTSTPVRGVSRASIVLILAGVFGSLTVVVGSIFFLVYLWKSGTALTLNMSGKLNFAPGPQA